MCGDKADFSADEAPQTFQQVKVGSTDWLDTPGERLLLARVKAQEALQALEPIVTTTLASHGLLIAAHGVGKARVALDKCIPLLLALEGVSNDSR